MDCGRSFSLPTSLIVDPPLTRAIFKRGASFAFSYIGTMLSCGFLVAFERDVQNSSPKRIARPELACMRNFYYDADYTKRIATPANAGTVRVLFPTVRSDSFPGLPPSPISATTPI